MDIHSKPGTRVRYIGCDDAQVSYGGSADDPRKELLVGGEYRVDHTEVHDWYSHVVLRERPGRRFNTVCFADMSASEVSVPVVNAQDLHTHAGAPATVAAFMPTTLSSTLTQLVADILKVRTWGLPLTAQESEKLDERLLEIAVRVKDWADKERGPAVCTEQPPPTVVHAAPALVIPPMKHQWSKGWSQPALNEIDLSNGRTAVMPLSAFKKLSEYSSSLPSGVYEGKMWRARASCASGWVLRWFDASPTDPDKCAVREVQIEVHWRTPV